MNKEMYSTAKKYTSPMVLSHQPVRFETKHSWNKGVGRIPSANGNGGINYPNDPRSSKKF